MPGTCTVLIAAIDLLAALKQRSDTGGEVLAFTDVQSIAALEAIISHRPQVVALERLFAATPRGAALINRIKSDPALTFAEIRVVSHDSDYSRISPRRHVSNAPACPPAAATLDYRGTRRELRVPMPEDAGALVDGAAVTLVDLSIIGAQVLAPAILHPNRGVRMTLTDDAAVVRFGGRVAWASLEMRPTGPRYRAGIEFRDARADAVRAFLARHSAA